MTDEVELSLEDITVLVSHLARQHLDHGVRRRLRSRLDALPRSLVDEEPLLLTDAFLEGFGLLVLTEDRLIFIAEDPTAEPVTIAFFDDQPLTATPADEPGSNGRDLTITVGGTVTVIEELGDPDWVEEFADAIHAATGTPRPPGGGGVALTSCPWCDATFDPPVPRHDACPSCGLALDTSSEPPPAPPAGPSRTPNGPVVHADGTATCPFCAEDIRSQAIVCRHCGLALTADAPDTGRGLPSPHQAGSTNGYAIASLTLGFLWLYGLGSLLALVFGYMAKSQITRSQGRQGGGGLATAGIVLGWLGLLGVVAIVVVALVTFNGTETSGY